MNRLVSRGLAAAVAFGVPGLASAADLDVKGKWVGKSHTVVAGKDAIWPNNTGGYDKPGLFEKDMVIEIVGQQDRRFWGKTIMGGAGDTKVEKPFVGHLHGKDGTKFLYADHDGVMTGEIEGDVLTFCYTHPTAPAGSSTVVSCSSVTKTR